jgi:localization factor PodJL
VQKRVNEIDAGRSEVPNKDALARLETALGQLQKRLNEMEAGKSDLPHKDALVRLEATLGQLQKRLGEMEAGKADLPQKDTLSRLENSVNEMRSSVAENDKRSREDLSQLAKFMRELSSRVDTAERAASQVGGAGKSLVEGVAARLDALEARAASQFDELRGTMSAMDARLQQATASAKGGVQAESFAALQRSVDTLSQRFDDIGDASSGPLAGPMGAIESTLETLTNKIEEGDRRAAESVSTVSNALKSISTRLEESEKRQAQSLQSLTRRLDESDRRAADSAHTVEDALKTLTTRLETSDKKHKEAIGGLRLTVDGLVAKAAAEALPVDSPMARSTSMPSPLSGAGHFAPSPGTSFDAPTHLAPLSSPPLSATREPDLPPPLATTHSPVVSDAPPPAFTTELPPAMPPRDGEGYSVSALQTIMAGTLSAPPPAPPEPLSDFEPEKFEPDVGFEPDEPAAAPKKADDFLAQARRAAQAAAQAESERQQTKRGYLPNGKGETGGSRNVGRLMIVTLACIALVAGIIALLFTLPGGDDGTNRPDAGASIGEILNGTPAPAAPAGDPTASTPPAPAAEFAPPSAPETAGAAGSVTAEPNGLSTQPEAAAPAFTSGTSALPGGPTPDTAIASLEAGAVRGDAKAQFVLALRYAEGRGVDKDDAKAVSLVTKAAQQGLVVAEYRLGAIYERGIGVPKDLVQARNWYEKAAKGGNRKAMHNLAVLYADGVAIGQNFQEAARWFRQGAEYGLADSQYNLAILLERGMGVEKNLAEAAKWYAIASGQGDSGAAERLDALKRQMSPGDIAISLDAARNFKAKALDPAANEVPAVNG